MKANFVKDLCIDSILEISWTKYGDQTVVQYSNLGRM